MKRQDSIAELAPAVVVRAALFPVRALLALADEQLVRHAAVSGTAPTTDFEAAYSSSMDGQRRALAAATVHDPEFARALCLTNDDLSRRIIRKDSSSARRTTRRRRLDATLYRHLARAVYRTEPCDMWAGVAIGSWGEQTCVTPTPPGYAVYPDLRPYQLLVQSLACKSQYVERGVYKLNPTLTFDRNAGHWRYTVRAFSSILPHARAPSPGVAALLGALAGMQPASLETLAGRLRRLGFDDEALPDVLRAFQAIGLLVGGLAFPRTFSSAWEALLAVAPQLRQEHARSWRSTVVRLRRLCRRLERVMGRVTVEELHAAQDEARAEPLALARALDVDEPVPLPRSALRCDTRLPFSIVLGAEMEGDLLRVAAVHDVFERRHGVDTAARAAHRALMLDGAPVPPPVNESTAVPSLDAAWRANGSHEVLGERLDRWSGWLRAGGSRLLVDLDERATELRPPPIGGVIVRPRARGFQVMGTTIEIAATYGRFGQLWFDLPNRARRRFAEHPLHQWYRTTLAGVADEAGVEIVEYVGPCEAMPNGLSRPRFGFRQWDRWGTSSPYAEDGMRIGKGTVPLAYADGHERPIALTCFSPVNLGYSEPALERLLLSSFREIPAWLGPGLPLESELAEEGPSPALAVAGDVLVRTRRMLLHGDVLAELVAASRPRRFLMWQALARQHSWPPLMLLSVDGGPPLPVVRDSPLALEAALHGLSPGCRLVCVEEPEDRPWLVNAQGDAFTAEIIVPFLRRDHAWSDLAPS